MFDQTAMTDDTTGVPSAADPMSESSSTISEVGVEEKIHLLQGQLHELALRIDTLVADLSRHRRLLVQISNRLHDFKLRQAEHDQHVRNFIFAAHRAAAEYIRFTDY